LELLDPLPVSVLPDPELPLDPAVEPALPL
jgi:hypothetical protein